MTAVQSVKEVYKTINLKITTLKDYSNLQSFAVEKTLSVTLEKCCPKLQAGSLQPKTGVAGRGRPFWDRRVRRTVKD